MPDYSKGQIYKIWDASYSKCYIGSTVEKLSTRMARHRDKYKQYLNGRYAFTSSFSLFDEFGCENCKIELIENYPCDSKQELHAREGQHIRKTDCVNKVIAGRTSKEYYQDTKEIQNLKNKEWRENNKEYKHEKDKEYRDEHKEEIIAKLKEKRLCECGCYISLRNLSAHKRKTKHIELMKQQNQ